MCVPNTITNFEDLQFEFLQALSLTESEEIDVKNRTDKSLFSHYTTDIAYTIGYLLGVKEEYLETIINDNEKSNILKGKIEQIESAKIIRPLNNFRSNLMLMFKKVSQTINVMSSNYKPIYQMDEFKDDYNELKKYKIEIVTGRSDINEYIEIINREINKRICDIKCLFPEWVDFSYIRNIFNMPSNIKPESEKFQNHQNCYPYKRHFNWKNPQPDGNILLSDEKILSVIYESNGDNFREINKVKDASDLVKNSISDFISNGEKTQIFIDGENVDPYKFESAIYDLKDHEIEKIDKITVFYDNRFSNKAWTMLKHFTYDIQVEAVGVDRIVEDKSLVDHKLVAGVSKAVYKDNVDSIIIVSSDSDFWSVIEDVEANYLVMVEKDICAHNFKDLLRQKGVFYCYLDNFMTPEDNDFFKFVFRKELESIITSNFFLGNAKNLFEQVLKCCRAELSDAEKESIYNKYIKGLTLTVNKEGNFEIKIPN